MTTLSTEPVRLKEFFRTRGVWRVSDGFCSRDVDAFVSRDDRSGLILSKNSNIWISSILGEVNSTLIGAKPDQVLQDFNSD